MTADPVRAAAEELLELWDRPTWGTKSIARRVGVLRRALAADQEPKREITNEMVEQAARALFDESPDMLDAGWEASPEKDIYRKAATAALSAALLSEAQEEQP